jgi:hypothetical protein
MRPCLLRSPLMRCSVPVMPARLSEPNSPTCVTASCSSSQQTCPGRGGGRGRGGQGGRVARRRQRGRPSCRAGRRAGCCAELPAAAATSPAGQGPARLAWALARCWLGCREACGPPEPAAARPRTSRSLRYSHMPPANLASGRLPMSSTTCGRRAGGGGAGLGADPCDWPLGRRGAPQLAEGGGRRSMPGRASWAAAGGGAVAAAQARLTSTSLVLSGWPTSGARMLAGSTCGGGPRRVRWAQRRDRHRAAVQCSAVQPCLAPSTAAKSPQAASRGRPG